MARRPVFPLLAAATLAVAGCGRDADRPAGPVIPPTEVTAVDTPPPEYPLALACAGIGGQTVLNVTIGTAGTPTKITLLRTSGNEELDRLAREAVQGWKFRPATRNGQPLERTIQVPVKFTPPQERPQACFALDAGRTPAS